MEKQEDVKQPTETTAEVEPSTTEPQPEEKPAEVPETAQVPEQEPQSSDIGQENESESKVSKDVPYDRFKKVNDENKKLKEVLAPLLQNQPQEETQPNASEMGNSYFDEPTQQGVEAIVAKKIGEARKTDELTKSTLFVRKYAKDLEDPLLRATTRNIIAEGNAQGQYIDQEDALEQAKALLDERIKPKVKEATVQGVEEGKEIARNKEQADAIGSTGAHKEITEDDLSADEFAKAKGLKKIL